MKNWTKYSFIRFLIPLILAVLIYQHTKFFSEIFYYIFGICIIAYFSLWYFIPKTKKTSYAPLLFSIAFLILLLFSWINTAQQDQTRNKKHIIHYPSQITHYKAKIIDAVEEKENTFKTEVEVIAIRTAKSWQSSTGKVLLYIRKDSTPLGWNYGDEILLVGSPQRVKNSGNPEAFDYAQFLAFRNIYHQDFIKSTDYQILKKGRGNFFLKAMLDFRTWASQRLIQLIKNPNEYAIASALILGVKDHLNQELNKAYSGAGLMHILAVSGLHVGLISITLGFLLQPLYRLPKGKIIFGIMLIFLLWLYAFITGFSPSVSRAVVMFSLLNLANITFRRTNIYNTLAVSAFLLLCWNPLWIYSVGFQLSYIAVIGIVYLYPKISYWWNPKYWILKKGWDIVCVSIAAQIATFPLGLYYFHQFPNYFLISNLTALPILPTLLYLGLSSLIFGGVPYLSEILAWTLKTLLQILNYLVFRLQELPFAISEGITLNLFETLLVYGIIILFLIFLEKKKNVLFYYLTAFILIFSVGRIYQSYEHHTQEKIVIFNTSRASNIAFLKNRENLILADSSLLKNPEQMTYASQEFFWKNGQYENNIQYFYKAKEIPKWLIYKSFEKYTIIFFADKKLLFVKRYIPKKEWEVLAKYDFDYLIIQKNGLRKLQKIIEFFEVKYLIIDSSNDFYNSRNLTEEADSLEIPYHNIPESGAFILEN